MPLMETPSTVPPPANPGGFAGWFRRVKVVAIATFVVFQLFFMVFRGGIDLNYNVVIDWLHKQRWWPVARPVFDPVDSFTKNYGNFLGIEQGWNLFAGPVARSALFLTARIEFDDGTEALVYSENEPDPKRYFRVGGWRQRKLEDYLCYQA